MSEHELEPYMGIPFVDVVIQLALENGEDRLRTLCNVLVEEIASRYPGDYYDLPRQLRPPPGQDPSHYIKSITMHRALVYYFDDFGLFISLRPHFDGPNSDDLSPNICEHLVPSFHAELCDYFAGFEDLNEAGKCNLLYIAAVYQALNMTMRKWEYTGVNLTYSPNRGVLSRLLKKFRGG